MMPADTPSFDPRRLWGKLGPSASAPAPTPYHPLLCHLIDVAAVAEAMWDAVLPLSGRRWLAAALGLDGQEDGARAWVSAIAGLHDLGKACPAFQLRPEAKSIIGLYSDLPRLKDDLKARDAPHGIVTARELPEVLVGLGLSVPIARRLSVVTGGHHGTFPRSVDIYRLNGDAVGKGAWSRARRDLAQLFTEVLNVRAHRPPVAAGVESATALAGLISVADWIGSNRAIFNYIGTDKAPPLDPAAYLAEARAKARAALDTLGWLGAAAPSEPRTFAALFPEIGDQPRPLQQAAIALAGSLTSAGIAIVEAPMGEGKTEAALHLADAWSVALGTRGLYVALPTQATSNQMFGRVRHFLEGRFPGEWVQLHLLHGHAALSAELELLQKRDRERRFDGDAIVTSPDDADPQGAAGGGAAAAEWFTYRKRGLLAPFGVGTVDQALLAALQTKHGFVRLFGLTRKVVIVDEVHAYDAYMSTLLERLLEWLGALGSPVLLLSATLPRSRRERLLDAYRRGQGPPATSISLPPAPYPRITWATADAAGAETFETSPSMRRTLRLERIAREPDGATGDFTLGGTLRELLANGGCAAVICNTVGRAQAVYRRLKEYFPAPDAGDGYPELDLFHARYRYKDRMEREERALRRFGKPAADGEASHRPRRAVLVATQVVEQSLDLDFDLMVTDLAPVDLVLQRAGRLWRHQRAHRPVPFTEPTLLVAMPAEKGNGPEFESGDVSVYDEHILLRSWLALRGRETVAIPDDVEDLIEQVYDDRGCPDDAVELLRRRWNTTWNKRQEQIAEEREEARKRWLKPPTFGGSLGELTTAALDDDSPDAPKAFQALTRLVPPSVTAVCLYEQSHGLTFDRAGTEPISLDRRPDLATTRRLLEHSLSISNQRVVHALLESAPPTAWRRSGLLRSVRVLRMPQGAALALGRESLWLDADEGLRIERR
jgi:CRISPR-associated endonuclease/helicase Cas3